MRLVIGVDAGGTSTIAAVACDGSCERVYEGPSSNASSRGTEAAAHAISETILAALNGALPDAIYVGAAGAGRASVARDLERSILDRFPNARVAVRDDARIALRASVPQGDGAVLVAGTGSIAYAERGEETFRSGGYGFLLGDDGSGFALGAAACKFALRVFDGRSPSDELAQAVYRALDARTADDILLRVYGSDESVSVVAALAPLVLDAAQSGQRSANTIVQQAAGVLAELIGGLVKKAQLAHTDAPIVLAGGLLRENSTLTFLLETRLQNELPSMPLRKNGAPPYRGALALAERLLNA